MAINEVCFEEDNFQQPKVLNIKESIAQLFLNIFLMKPGNMPSLPNIGINIEKYLYEFEENIDLDELKKEIFNQCSQLVSFVSLGEIQAYVLPYEDTTILLIVIPILDFDDSGEDGLIFSFQRDTDNQLSFRYQFEKQAISQNIMEG